MDLAASPATVIRIWSIIIAIALMFLEQDSLEKDLEQVNVKLDHVAAQIHSLLNEQSALTAKKQTLESQLKFISEQQVNNHDWSSKNFEWSEVMNGTCRNVFGINSYRPLQLEAINVTLQGMDCLLVLPTGAGKSLCYQLPAVISNGLTLVISPLVSLMQDQVMRLTELGVNAEMLNADSSKDTVTNVMAAMVKPGSKLRLLYVTPEKLAKSKRFMNKLEKSYEVGILKRIAIDEVHCCSHWGHDFRPDYKFLGILKRQFKNVPILGLTATASNHIIADVKKILQIPHALVFRGSFNRKNLFYSVQVKSSDHGECMDQLASTIKTKYANQSGIVYCLSRKDTETVSNDLRKRGIKSSCYHADVSSTARNQIHRLWILNKLQVIVATIAFGMGIDKSDVRFVIHHSISKSMENYYQESGRAGRDGKKADCVLLYRLADVFRQSVMTFTEHTGLKKLYGILEYSLHPNSCRRQLLAKHFDESWGDKSCQDMCDRCTSLSVCGEPDNQNVTIQLVYSILEAARVKDVRMTSNKILDTLAGKNVAKLGSSMKSQLSREECERVIGRMLLDSKLREDFHFTPYSTISYLVKGEMADCNTGHETDCDTGCDTSRDAGDSSSKTKKRTANSKKSEIKRQKKAKTDSREIIVLD